MKLIEPITKRQVVDTIGNYIADDLNSYGFKYIKSKSHIIKRFKDGYHRIILTTRDGFPNSCQELSIHFRLRIHSVEKIVNKFYDDRFMNPEFHNVTDSFDFMWNSLSFDNPFFLSDSYKKCSTCKNEKKEELIKYSQFKLFLHDINDIKIASEVLSSLIIDKGIKHFNEFTDLNILNAKYKKNVKKNNHLSGDLHRLMRSLTIMKLLNDTDFEKSCEVYQSILKPADWNIENSHNALNELIEYLKSGKHKCQQ